MSIWSSEAAARRLVAATALLGTVAVSLNNTALNPAIPQFITVFGIDAVAASWVITAFMICMGVTMPATAWLGNRFGKKRVYLTGLALFLAGSCLGALAPSMAWVIAARCIQGVAGGLMIPLSLALVFEVYPKEERGRISGWWGMAVMLAPAVGPLVGGLLVQFSSWHMLFAFNIPVGLAGWIIGRYWLPSPAARTPQKFDWQGFLLATIGVGTLLAALSRVKGMAGISDPFNIGLVMAALLCLACFVHVELRQQAPLLNLRIFAEPSYSLSVVVVAVQSVGMFATAVTAGLCSTLGGRLLDKHGPRIGVAAGLVCSALATMGLGLAGAQASLWLVVALMAARGVGLGLSYMPVTTAGLNAIPEHLVTEGAAMNNILRRIIASLAVVAVSLYFELRRAQLGDAIALKEIFIAIGLLLLATVPVALLFPKPGSAARTAPAAAGSI
jgi:MFS family permease